jgi:multiple sugar transport system permease protein
MAAFSIVKLRPKFSFAIFLIIYSGTVFPFQMYLIPLFNIYNNLGLYNTKIGMIILYSAICTPFAVFLYRGSLLGITDSIMEAALIDGCSPVKLYANIYLPLLTAPTAVVVLFQAIWIWNDMLFGMILTTTESARPIMVAITQIAGTGGGNIPVLMAGVIITSIPTVLLFIVLRKHFIQGYSFGAYKK